MKDVWVSAQMARRRFHLGGLLLTSPRRARPWLAATSLMLTLVAYQFSDLMTAEMRAAETEAATKTEADKPA